MSDQVEQKIDLELARKLAVAYELAKNHKGSEEGDDVFRMQADAFAMQKALERIFGTTGIEKSGRPLERQGRLNINPAAFGTSPVPTSATGPEIVYELLQRSSVDSLSALKGGLMYFVNGEGRDCVDAQIEMVRFIDEEHFMVRATLVF